MRIYRFYSSWYDKHKRYEELEKLGIDTWSKIPKEFRSESYDYLIDDIQSKSIHVDRLHICENLPHQGEKWSFAPVNDGVNNKFNIQTFVSEYPETIEGVDSLPNDLTLNFYVLMILINALLESSSGADKFNAPLIFSFSIANKINPISSAMCIQGNP